MALTPWPDFATATATDWEPLAAILHAVQERAGVARAFHLGASSSRDWEGFWISFGYGYVPGLGFKNSTYDGKKAPALDVLNAIRDGILALAPYFLNLDRREGRSGYGKPQTWSGADLLALHPHLAILPERGAVEACADTLSDYRAFLADAAGALDRLRYVDAIRLVAYRKAISVNATGTPSDCRSALGSPSVETFTAARRYPFSRRNREPRFSFVRHFHRNEADAWDWDSHSWTHSVADTESVDANASADIYIANPTPMEARILVFGYSSESLPYWIRERSVESVITRQDDWVMFGERSTSRIERETVARIQKEILRNVENETQDDDEGERAWETTETTTVWSDDATRSKSSTETESGSGGRMDTTHPPEEFLNEGAYGFPAYSGFEWPCAMPDPQLIGTAAPHSQANVLPAPSSMPAPVWEDLSALSKSPGGVPRQCGSEFLRSFEATAMFVFDFGLAFKYGGEAPDEEEEEEVL